MPHLLEELASILQDIVEAAHSDSAGIVRGVSFSRCMATLRGEAPSLQELRRVSPSSLDTMKVTKSVNNVAKQVKQLMSHLRQ